MQCIPFGRLSAACLFLISFIVTTHQANAQGFQFRFGNNTCSQAGLYGGTQLASGGFVQAGAYTSGATCAATDAYIVRMNANGSLAWAATLDLGGSDSATDVLEASNGDIVICGVTRNTVACGGTRDMFFARLNSTTGAVINTATIGSSADDIAWDIEEAITGNNSTAFVGDILVAGSTTNSPVAPSTKRDAVLLRLSSTFVYRWGRQYGGSGAANGDDYFYSVAEVTVGVPAGTTGDLFAIGGTTSWGAGAIDIFAARVNGTNGTIGLAPQGGATYGFANSEACYRVRELRTTAAAPYQGDFIACGSTNSRPPAGTNSEAVLLQLTPKICDPQRADCWFGDATTGIDVASDVQEVRSNVGGLPIGRIVVSGVTVLSPAGTVTGENMYLKEFQLGPAGLLLPNAGMVYGGTARDWGTSVGVCARSTATETPGYVIGGYTQSPNLLAAGDPRSMYFVKARVNRTSGCNETPLTVTPAAANFTKNCPTVSNFAYGIVCNPVFTRVGNDWNQQLCYALPVTHERNGGGNDGAVPAGVADPDAISGVRVFPNPTASGTTLTITGLKPECGSVELTVADVSGRTVYRNGSISTASEITVPTDGWAAGAYFVEVVCGKTRALHRVVVTGR